MRLRVVPDDAPIPVETGPIKIGANPVGFYLTGDDFIRITTAMRIVLSYFDNLNPKPQEYFAACEFRWFLDGPSDTLNSETEQEKKP